MFEPKWSPYEVTSQEVDGLRFVEPETQDERACRQLRDQERLRVQRMRDSFRQDHHPLDWPTEH